MKIAKKMFLRALALGGLGVSVVASDAHAFGDLLEGDYTVEASRQISQVIGSQGNERKGIIEGLNLLKGKKGKGFHMILLDSQSRQRVDQYAPGCDLEIKKMKSSKSHQLASIHLIGTGSAEGYFPNEVMATVLDPATVDGTKISSAAFLVNLSKKSRDYRFYDLVEMDASSGAVVITKQFEKLAIPGARETFAIVTCVFADEN